MTTQEITNCRDYRLFCKLKRRELIAYLKENGIEESDSTSLTGKMVKNMGLYELRNAACAIIKKKREVIPEAGTNKNNQPKNTMKTQTINYRKFNNPELAEAVVEQFGGEESFLESCQDVNNHGIDGGFHGFIYHSDTCKFSRENMDLIKKSLNEMADATGQCLLEMVQSFRCIGKDYSLDDIAEVIYGSGDDTTILNGLAWYAGEEMCNEFDNINS